MKARHQARFLPDGRRLHLQDGPIDLIIEAFGATSEIERAYRAAAERFSTILDDLCADLPVLRRPATGFCSHPLRKGESQDASIARAMHDAVRPFAGDHFITPMAAVAGSVADEILRAMTVVAELDRAYVNNGGDIALHLAGEARFRIGMVDRPDTPGLFGHVELGARDKVRGIATSGCRGRSFSLGIADAVTVLASTAAKADAAATILANAVDLPGHAGIHRCPAAALQPDSDLGDRLVTRSVAPLSRAEIDSALAAGVMCGEDLLRCGLIAGAAFHLQGVTRVTGAMPSAMRTPIETKDPVDA